MRTRWPSLVDIRTNSTLRRAVPCTRPLESDSTTRPSTRAPLSAITHPSTTSGPARVARKLSPGRLRLVLSVSPMRTSKFTPACSITLFGAGGGGGSAAGGSVAGGATSWAPGGRATAGGGGSGAGTTGVGGGSVLTTIASFKERRGVTGSESCATILFSFKVPCLLGGAGPAGSWGRRSTFDGAEIDGAATWAGLSTSAWNSGWAGGLGSSTFGAGAPANGVAVANCGAGPSDSAFGLTATYTIPEASAAPMTKATTTLGFVDK